MKRPELVLLTYNLRDHVDNHAKPCHGIPVVCSLRTRDALAPHVSKGVREWVSRMLHLGITVDVIHDKFLEVVRNKINLFPNQTNRDLFLSREDIYNIEQRMNEVSYLFDKNDDNSVRIWRYMNPEKVFHYQEFQKDDNGGTPFIIGLQDPIQLDWMIRFGHNSMLSMDSTFGTNKQKLQLFTILAFDEHQNGIPVAWVIMSRATIPDISSWLEMLYHKVNNHKPD
eukprot:Gb_17664 [translate_table: standard]